METESDSQEVVRPELITQDEARLLMRAHKRAVLKLASSGKPLPASTLKQVMSVLSGGDGDEPTFAKNQVELAAVLGVSRRTISRYLRVEGNPGARPDGRYDVVAWRQFLQAAGAVDDDSDDSEGLRRRLMAAQIRKIDNHNAIVDRTYVPVTDVERWGAELGMAIRKIVTQIHLMAPSLTGLPVPETEIRLKEMEDELLRQLSGLDDSVEDWKSLVSDA